MEISLFYSVMVVTNHMWLLNTWHMAGMIKELNFNFYLIISNLNSHMWVSAAMLGVRGLDSLLIHSASIWVPTTCQASGYLGKVGHPKVFAFRS